jgi:DNA-binding transcriptional LysR family regulator
LTRLPHSVAGISRQSSRTFLMLYPGLDVQLHLIDGFVDMQGLNLGKVDLVLRAGQMADTRLGSYATGEYGAYRLCQPRLFAATRFAE